MFFFDRAIVSIWGMSIMVRHGKLLVETGTRYGSQMNYVRTILNNSKIQAKRWFRIHFRVTTKTLIFAYRLYSNIGLTILEYSMFI